MIDYNKRQLSIMKPVLLLLISSLVVFAFSCKSSESELTNLVSKYVKKNVRNGSSVIIHDYKVYDNLYDNKTAQYSYIQNETNTISNNSVEIRVIFSAKNSEGNEVFREVSLLLDSLKKDVKESIPKNIDVESGYLSGTCNYYFGNLITGWQLQDYCKGANIILVNEDTINSRKKYISKVDNGTYQINKVLPGQYILKLIQYNVNAETVYRIYGTKYYYRILLHMQSLMQFYRRYHRQHYGYTDKFLFDTTLSKIDSNLSPGNSIIISDSEIESLWNDFKKSISPQFISDFEINDDYKYLHEFRTIIVEPSIPTQNNIEIKNYFF